MSQGSCDMPDVTDVVSDSRLSIQTGHVASLHWIIL